MAASYLLFVQGVQAETHIQNILLELDAGGRVARWLRK
jgi:hypothetical protein